MFFAVLAVLWWWPLPLHLRTGQLESPPIDAAFNQWILGWGMHALTTDPLHYFDANMFHPFDNVLAWGDHLFAVALTGVALRPLLGVVGTYNFLLVAGSALSAFGAYKLGHAVSGDRAAGIVVGSLWAFSTSRTLEMSHIQILSTQWIPFVFLYAERLRKGGGRGPMIGFAGSTWLVLATNVYLAAYTGVMFAVYAVVATALRTVPLRAAVRIAAGGAVAALVAVPLYVPSVRVQGELGIARSLEEQSGASLEALLPLPVPGRPAQEVFGYVDPREWRYDTVGLLTVALLVLTAVLVATRRTGNGVRTTHGLRHHVPFLVAGTILAASAQGPSLRWKGDKVASNPVFLALYHSLPGFDALRVPARAFIVGTLGIAVFAGWAAARLLAGRPPVLRGAVVVLAAAFVLFEQAPPPLHVGPSYTVGDGSVYRWLAEQDGDFPILELPISVDLGGRATQVMEGRRMSLSTVHWKRRLGGGISPTIDPAYPPRAAALDNLGADPHALALLRNDRVRYVVVVPEDYVALGRADGGEVVARLDRERGLRRVRQFDDAVVYRVIVDGE